MSKAKSNVTLLDQFDDNILAGPGVTKSNLTPPQWPGIVGSLRAGALHTLVTRTGGYGQYGNWLSEYLVTAPVVGGEFDSGITSWTTSQHFGDGAQNYGSWFGANTPSSELGGQTFAANGAAIGMELNAGNRWGDPGLLLDVGTGRYTVGLQIVPDVLPAPDGVTVGVYPGSFGVMLGASVHGHRWWVGNLLRYDTLMAGGYGRLENGGSTAPNAPQAHTLVSGYWVDGIDLSPAFFSGSAIKLGTHGVSGGVFTPTSIAATGTVTGSNLSGTNTGDQTITLTNDVTGSGTGSFATTIANGAVSLAKMADMATASVFYRKTAGSGAPEIQTLATLKTDLGLTGTNTGDQTITLTGDVTGSGTGSFAATIANAAVTYAKMQNVSATSRILGRITAGAGSPEELTAANVKTILALTSSDVGLGSVTNDAQTKAAIVPNTAPSAGQVLLGNAGGTAYAPITLSGPVSITSAGVTAVATLNQNTTGSAAKWTTPRNLAGNSVDGSANVAFANAFIVQGTADTGLSAAQFLGALGTGILKNTTTTGVLSIAVAGDFPTLNQNTTGSAAKLTTARLINGTSFDGSADITVAAAAGTLTGATLAAGVTASSLTSVGTLTSLTSSGLITVTADASAFGVLIKGRAADGIGTIKFTDNAGTTESARLDARTTGSLLVELGSSATVSATFSSTGLSQVGVVSATGGLTGFNATAIAAGANTQFFAKGSSTANFGVFYGSGAPTFTAAANSLYLRSDGSTTTTRMYVNTTGSTTWATVTTSA